MPMPASGPRGHRSNRPGSPCVSGGVALFSVALGSCGPSSLSFTTGLEGLALDSVAPEILIPGTRLELEGRSFVAQPWAETALVVDAAAGDGDVAAGRASLPVTVRDAGSAYVDIDDDALIALGGEAGEIAGEAWVAAESAGTGETYESERIEVNWRLREELAPDLAPTTGEGLFFVNDRIPVEGGGILLGREGQTVATLEGCFRPLGEDACAPREPAVATVKPDRQTRRDRGSFPLSPEVAGIERGVFEGTITFENRHDQGGADVGGGGDHSVSYRLAESVLRDIGPDEASLGQYVVLEGAGFLRASQGHTILAIEATFEPDAPSGGEGEAAPIDLDLELVPEALEGRRARLVMDEDHGLGRHIDLRAQTGELSGQARIVTAYEESEVESDPISFSLGVAPVRQVVELRFLDSYVESLRRFGLRAVDGAIRDRVEDVVRRDYATINLEVRRGPVEDFELYSVAEIAGPDPNGLGLLGYDNTPGKDVGNQRLHDHIGGVNALTQRDGFPGYGGIFIESLLQLSADAGSPLSDPLFDDIFDPFRPDRDGEPVTAADLAGGVPSPSSGEGCPAPDGDRQDRIACAIWVLGSMVGTTLSHEIGHSLGLANPEGEGFHNTGNRENRLMDSGHHRPFVERAELDGRGPARFCEEAYLYLRQILPTDEPAELDGRQPCS